MAPLVCLKEIFRFQPWIQFDPRRKNSAVSHREEGKPSERSCRATGADDRLFVVAQATFASVSMIDTHILGWFAKQVKQVKGLFSECVDSQFVQASDRRHEFPLPRGGHR